MKKHSVDVLNEAYDFERKLNWVLFKAEQEALLYRPGEEWYPGDAMWSRPEYFRDTNQQYIRCMIEEIDMGVFNNQDRVLFEARCEPCQVSWEGPGPCWVCGMHVKPYAYDKAFDVLADYVRRDLRVDMAVDWENNVVGTDTPATRASRLSHLTEDSTPSYQALIYAHIREQEALINLRYAEEYERWRAHLRDD